MQGLLLMVSSHLNYVEEKKGAAVCCFTLLNKPGHKAVKLVFVT